MLKMNPIIKHKSWVEVSKSALLHNVKVFRKSVGKNVKLAAVVKANAYGHDLAKVVPILKNKVDVFAVDNIDEALIVRCLDISTPVLILGYTTLVNVHLPIENDISFVVSNLETLKKIISLKLKKPAKIHLKIETGLNRQGVKNKDLSGFLRFIRIHKNQIILEGVYTHFANIEDTLDPSFAMEQFSKFKRALKIVKLEGFNPPQVHAAASAGTLLYPETHFSMVRVGFGIYGWWMSIETRVSILAQKRNIILKPVLTWKSLIAQIKQINVGESVGYGQTWFAARKTKVAVVPVGYSDGYDRKLSNIGRVIVKGRYANVIGRVAMNMIMIDVTDIPGVELEDEVALLGNKDGLKVSADEWAKKIGTINYEVVSRINPLLPRIIVK
ncbi:MAG TPA: alanine racemase [Candidatus Saccharimonadales bacterium]|jgi:alanine racemase|nr:alanine racemase [Candidatus Saccharimonadales bacterium]